MNHIGRQDHIINAEIASIFNTLNNTESRIEDHMIYMTEDTDCCPLFMDTAIGMKYRPGLETIERQRWGRDQQKHGKTSRFRGTGKRYAYKPTQHHEEDPDMFRNELHGGTAEDNLDILGFPVEADPVQEIEQEEWYQDDILGYWFSETIPKYAILTSLFSIVGDYEDPILKFLEVIQWETRGMSPEQKRGYVVEHLTDIEKMAKVRFK